jgi:hypothetical protein
MFDPVKIALHKPVMHGEVEIRELHFTREMKAGDLRGIKVGAVSHDDIFELASRLTGVPTPVIREMGVGDYLRVAEVVSNFLGDGR